MSLEAQLYDIIKPFDNFQCQQCANALLRFVKRYGKRYGIQQVKQLRLETGYTNVYDVRSRITYAGKLIAETGFHVAIDIDGLVYDNLNPRGVPKVEWSNNFERVVEVSAFQVKLGRYETFIITETIIDLE